MKVFGYLETHEDNVFNESRILAQEVNTEHKVMCPHVYDLHGLLVHKTIDGKLLINWTRYDICAIVIEP